MGGTVLILGPSGRFGRHSAEAFWARGWNVRLFDRSTDDLMRASDGVDVIVNGWNTPYTDWETLVPRLTEQVI
ncbi:MAG: epimerase, partial [Pseudomonadota bacterium]